MSGLAPSTVAPVSRTQIARYAGAVGDFNPMHVDEAFAVAAGMPSVIAHGPLTLSLAIDAIVNQVGAHRLRSFSARLRQPVFPGQSLEVVPVEGGVEVRNDSGDVVATAEVELGTAP